MKRTAKKSMDTLQYIMTIKSNFAIAKCKGFDSSTTMPVCYAMEHMRNVCNIAKTENVHVEWTVVFE